jgi:hypothetical protein
MMYHASRIGSFDGELTDLSSVVITNSNFQTTRKDQCVKMYLPRVVWRLCVTMASLEPTSRFIKVLLPALGAPTMATVPHLCVHAPPNQQNEMRVAAHNAREG